MTAVVAEHGLDGLLDATGGHPFVRWEVTDELAATWWGAADAVAFQRSRVPLDVVLPADRDRSAE